MLSATSRPYIDASVPVLREHGHTITRQFYQNMFAAHPELHNLFNLGNQASGVQQQSLAAAVFAYAANIDNAAALAPVLERIVHKHAAVGIVPAHYPIVGRHLLGAIQQVLGDAATPALMAAWDEAYWLLAGELIAAEARLYQTVGQAPGALQTLRVVAREDDSANVVSWYLQTADGRSPGAFVPGQYVSVAVQFDHPAVRQLRQYSLSDHPAQPHWRITVKREAGQADTPAGRVSNWLHSHLHVGDSLPVSAAFGDFQPQLDGDTPLVLMSAGVGVTPMTAVLASLAAQGSPRPLHWLHACRDGQHQVLRSAIDQAAAQLPQLQRSVWYETPQASDQQGKDYQHAGRMQLDGQLPAQPANAHYYLCGPAAFMRAQWQALLAHGVPMQQIQREVFGPELLEHLLG